MDQYAWETQYQGLSTHFAEKSHGVLLFCHLSFTSSPSCVSMQYYIYVVLSSPRWTNTHHYTLLSCCGSYHNGTRGPKIQIVTLPVCLLQNSIGSSLILKQAKTIANWINQTDSQYIHKCFSACKKAIWQNNFLRIISNLKAVLEYHTRLDRYPCP